MAKKGNHSVALARRASCSVGTVESFFPRVKRPGNTADTYDHLPPYSISCKNEYNYSATSPCAFMACTQETCTSTC